ncbi:MAG TPA: LLM class flavin-dependent oxidoreductase [Candidatus Dojkabacteria bacterium]|nr:LLM class flavin-dependent oxidoreductase [Candidatus Dojkabacteria bacterium]
MNQAKSKKKSLNEKITFSLLDFGLRSIDYAITADRLGFKRIWLTEHHVSDSIAAWYNPMMLLPILAGMTEKIIVGIAGTQLAIHNQYHTAVNYKLLANLFPNRIDLGIAAGSPEDNIKDYLPTEKYSFKEKRQQLVHLLRHENELAENKRLLIPPYKGFIPNIWFLSSNYDTLEDVVRYKVCFSRSLFHGWNLDQHKEELEAFRLAYYKQHEIYPNITLAVAGCVHHSDSKAKQIAEQANYKGISRINIIGCAQRFKDTILKYQEEFGFNEFTFLNVARKPEDRNIALSLIQKSFNF